MSIQASRLPNRSAQNWHRRIASGLALALTACGPGTPDPAREAAEILAKIETAYDQQLAMIDPDFVVVTYPESIAALSEFKRKEFDAIRLSLKRQNIRHEFRSRAQCMEQITVGSGRRQKEYQAFVVPAAAMESCQGGLLLFLNLDVKTPIYSSQHPEATRRKITVKVWNDPVTLPESWQKLYGNSTDKPSKS